MATVVVSAYNVANTPEFGGHFWVYFQYAHALRRLGCRRIPAYVVDYASEEIALTTWPGASTESLRWDRRGPSCTSAPTPWPSPWPK